MSFLKSYYTSVSSFLTRENAEEDELIDDNVLVESEMKESKSEGWLQGIYNGAYNQSGELWKAVKTDLSEFATVISKDAKIVVVNTAIGVKNGLVGTDENPGNTESESSDMSKDSTSKFKSSIYKIFDQVSKALYIPPESDDDDYYDKDDSTQTTCSRIETRIANLQRTRCTFENDPSPSESDPDLGDFTVWKDKLNIGDFQSTIAELIKSNQYLFDHYADLVPGTVTHDEFWSRYFYRVASINSEESRREALKLRISDDEKATCDADTCDWDEGNDMYDEPGLLNKTDQVDKELPNQEQEPSHDDLIDEGALKCKEKDGVIVVTHSIESSSGSDENNAENYHSMDDDGKGNDDAVGWDDEIDVELNEEDIELAKKVSDADVIETKWDDWS